MSATVILVVLAAAAIHATWHALLKSGLDYLVLITLMQILTSTVALIGLSMVPAVPPESWPYLVAGAGLHLIYRLLLVYAYRNGALSEVYPIARGSAPLLVAAFSLVVLGEELGLYSGAGILLISAGIFLLRRSGLTQIRKATLMISLLLGAITASYTIVDGLGARVSGLPVNYMLTLFAFGGPTTVTAYVVLRGFSVPKIGRIEFAKAASISAGSMLAYGMVVWAMTNGPFGPISALRETSIFFAVVIGVILFREPMTWRRGLACILVVGGAGCLGISV